MALIILNKQFVATLPLDINVIKREIFQALFGNYKNPFCSTLSNHLMTLKAQKRQWLSRRPNRSAPHKEYHAGVL